MTTHNPLSDLLSKCVGKYVGKYVGTAPGAPRESGASEGPSPYGGTDTLDELNAVRRPGASALAADRSLGASRTGVLEVPGEPMFLRPRGLGWNEQTIRPMIQLLPVVDDDDQAFAIRCDAYHHCSSCDVRWAGEAGCWMCGRAA